MFWDTIINESVPDCYADLGYKTVSTNPCGEIPLCPYDSCRLLAMNLFSYVENPFTEQATFNFDLFKKHIHVAQRIMDDIIDLELEKIDAIIAKIDADPELDEVKATERNLWLNIKTKANEGRRTGIGITAEGDMLAALGIKYGSKKGNAFSVEVHKTLGIEAYRASVYAAKDRGAFAIFDAEREKNNPFIQRLKEADDKLYYEMLEHGRRNIALLTIAPTGTTSLMTQTSSGIEPVFMPVYKRRRKVNPNDKNVRVDFVDEVGDATEELVGQLYLEAWEAGCKGVTVYRDGSRSGVLISNEEKKDDEQETLTAFPTKRPQVLEADVVRFQNNKEKWIAFIGLIDGKPYEVFTGLADDEDGILIPRWANSGLIIKNKNEDGTTRYDFQYKNKRGYKTTIEGLSHKFNPEFWNYAKLISSTLRHGMPIDKIVDLINSLQLDSESINTWKNGVVRALKRYVADGTRVKGQACTNCSSGNLIYQEGCLTCKDCGSSKCG